jgi:peptidyl-prolyl cis-trans isomerase SurA
MKERAITGPVTTLDGVEILLLIDKRQALTSDADDAVISLRRILLPLPANATPEGIATQMRLASVVGETVRDCDDMARVAREVRSPGSPDIGKFRIGDLAGPIRAAVQALAVGKASAPIRDKEGVSVLMVCQRTDPPSNLPTATELEERLRNERVENAARRYMRDLRYAAVVDVRV